MILVLITSVINPGTNKYSYSHTRSKFSMEQRFAQTKNTINTVNSKINSRKIIFIETSDIPTEYETFIKDNVDIYINLYNNPAMIAKTSNSSKSLGEGSQTIYGLQYIIDNDLEYSHLIKISGRYYLSDKFTLDKYINDNIVVKPINHDKNNILTALYKLPRKYVTHLLTFLKQNINQMEKCIGYEILFARFISQFSDVNFIDIVGLQGRVAVCGSFYDG